MNPDEEKETTFDPPVEDLEMRATTTSRAESELFDDEAQVSGESEIERLRSALAAAEQAAAESRDLYLRERAELENFKKRSMRDRSEALRYAAEPLARDLFTVVDNLERALEHARGSGDTSPVVQGVELVLKDAAEMLERHGIERIDATGAEFDPAVHEAVAQVADPSVEANHVVQQFLPGYRLHERLLRAAQVTVSTGPEHN